MSENQDIAGEWLGNQDHYFGSINIKEDFNYISLTSSVNVTEF